MKEKDLDLKTWKSGRHMKSGPGHFPHDVELRLSMKAAQRFRHVCQYCMEHKRDCPMCAGVI